MNCDELNYAEFFAKNLTKLLEKADMSQSDLARELGLSRSTLNKYCKGISLPTPPTIVRMAEAMGVTTDQLLLDSELEGDEKAEAAKELIEERAKGLSASQLSALATIMKGLK